MQVLNKMYDELLRDAPDDLRFPNSAAVNAYMVYLFYIAWKAHGSSPKTIETYDRKERLKRIQQWPKKYTFMEYGATSSYSGMGSADG